MRVQAVLGESVIRSSGDLRPALPSRAIAAPSARRLSSGCRRRRGLRPGNLGKRPGAGLTASAPEAPERAAHQTRLAGSGRGAEWTGSGRGDGGARWRDGGSGSRRRRRLDRSGGRRPCGRRGRSRRCARRLERDRLGPGRVTGRQLRILVGVLLAKIENGIGDGDHPAAGRPGVEPHPRHQADIIDERFAIGPPRRRLVLRLGDVLIVRRRRARLGRG